MGDGGTGWSGAGVGARGERALGERTPPGGDVGGGCGMAVGWGVARTGMRMGSPRLVAGRDMARLERQGTAWLARAAQACSLGSHRRTRSEAREAGRERERGT